MERPYCGYCDGGDLNPYPNCPGCIEDAATYAAARQAAAASPSRPEAEAPEEDGSLGPPARTSQHAYVYCIGPGGSPVKVGVSGDTHARRAALQIGHPERLEVWFAARIEPAAFAYEIEALVHRSLNHCRMSGEWFNVEPVTAARAICDAVEAAKERLK